MSDDTRGQDPDEISYRELVQSANTIVLRWDLQGRVTFLNDYGLEFFGYPRDELVGRSVVGTIVPETETSGRDLAQMIAELLRIPTATSTTRTRTCAATASASGSPGAIAPCTTRPAGVRELLSIGIDTTERKRAEEALRDSEQRYRVLFQSTPIALVERDVSALKAHLDALQAAGVADIEAHLQAHPDAVATCLAMVKVTDVNAAAMALFETDDTAILDAFPYIADRAHFTSLVRRIVADLATGQIASQQREATIRTLRGNQRNVLARTTVVPGFETDPVARRDRADRHHRAQASRGGAARQRGALPLSLRARQPHRPVQHALPLREAAARSWRRTGAPCSVIFMDLDRFKQVVDTYGHLNGSRAIQEVAPVIQASIREPEFAVAYAGDEFVIVLPGSNKTQAMAIADGLRAQIRAKVFLAEVGLAVRLSASFGVATYPDDAANMQALLAVADQALFSAKSMGRDTVTAARRVG